MYVDVDRVKWQFLADESNLQRNTLSRRSVQRLDSYLERYFKKNP